MIPLNLNRLNRREKYYVSAAVVVVAVFILFQFIIFPVRDSQDRLQRMLVQKTDELTEMTALQDEYKTLENKAQRARSELARRDENFSLYSYLGTLADTVGIKGNISSMKPSTTVVADVTMDTVELKIDTITTEQLATYLHKVEYSGNNLFIKRMVVSATSKPEGYIDVSLQVETVSS